MLRILALALVALIGVAPVTDPILRDLQQRLSTLEREAVRGKRLADAHDADRLLGPRSLAAPISVRGASPGGIPDLAAPLTARLRDDAMTGSFASGSIATPYPNLLEDPLLENAGGISSNLTTSYTGTGAWEAKYVLNSGTAPVFPSALGLSPTNNRGDYTALSYGFQSSELAEVLVTFSGGAADLTIYLRPTSPWEVAAEFVPSWLTASLRAVANQMIDIDSAVAYLEITDSTDALVAQSDPLDLAALADLTDAGDLETALEGPEASELYRWRLRVDIAATASTGAIAVVFADPLLAYSDDGTPPPFSPAIGPMFTGAGGAAASTTSALGARVRRTTNQSINDATDTVLNWSSATYDSSSFFDGATPGRLTVPQDGTYHCTAQVTWAAGAGGNRRDIWFIVNGSTGTIYARGRTNPSGAVQKYAQASIDLSLSAGDYVSCYVHQDSGGALDAVGTDHNTFFAIHKIGGAKGDTGATGAAGPSGLTDHTHAATGSGSNGGGATLAPTSLTLAGTLVASGVASVTMTGDENDWNPTGLSGASVLSIDPSGGSHTFTGLAAQPDGTMLWVQNVDSGSTYVYFDHESASSSAANRILTYEGFGGRLPPGVGVWLRYSGALSRWVSSGQAWNPGEDGDISDLAFGDTAAAEQTASGLEFAPAAHVHGMPANPFPTGAVVPYAGTSAPTGFLLCDGSAVSRTTYADLFTVCSTTYGAGDGSTTFNLPDLRQRFVLGKAASGTGNALGAAGGSIDHTHSYSQVVNHTHAVTITDPGHQHGMAEGTTDGAGIFADRSNAAAAAAMVTDSATTGITASTANPAGGVASGTTGSTNPPFIALNFIIKT